MKKIIKTLVVVLVVVIAIAAFTACGPTPEPTTPAACEHTGGAATCTEAAVCELCGESYGKALGHKEAFTTPIQPTCTEEGISGSSYCSVCGEVFIEAIVIPANGHEMEEVAAKDPTCTEDGYTAHNKCEVCGFVEGKETIEALGHTAGDAATCTTAQICTVCEEELVAALGHTPGAEATCTTAQICTVCEEELVAKLDHIDENGDIECDREGCTSKVAPPADSVLSNFTANNLGSKLSTDRQYYVVGTIVEVLDAKNGIFYLDDGTGEKFYFRLPKNADGVSHSSWEVKLVVGDKVQVYGKINKYTSSSAPNGQYWPAIQGGVVTILEQHPHDFTFKAATCSDPAYCACGQSHGEPLGCADTDGDQLCDDCGKNVNYVYEYVELRTDNGSGVHDATALTYTWSNDNFSIQVAKANGGNLYVTSNNHMRLYKNNQLIITNKNGIEVKTITVYVTNATQVTNFEKFLTGYTYTTDAENFTITVEINSADTITFLNPASTTQIMGIEFGYEKPEEPALSNAVLDLTTKDNRTYYDAADKQVWEANGIKLTNTKGEGTSNVQDKAPFAAWAKGYVIIEGKGIKTIRVVCSTTTLGTFFSRSLKAVENPNFTYSNSGTTYTIVFNEEVDIFELYLTDQTAFKSITINPEV